MRILVIGGAGYIGSHNVHALIERGDEVVVLDNLATGHRQAVHPAARFYEGDLRSAADLDKVLAENRVDAVMHFAAFSLVGESVQKPLKYFNNNVGGMMSLLEAMERHGVDRLVFSSTAAVYGEPKTVPIVEDAEKDPTNPYGESKLIMERMMRWAGQACGIRSVILRYFNVGGALEDGSIGEDHRPESHLIPLILQVPLGRRPHISIFGDDYPTQDGTCIRDYLHVMDLADAHLRALDYLAAGGESTVCNLGNGQGFSVLEMVEAARRVTGHPLPAKIEGRRAGDPARLVASSDRAKAVLGWQPHAGIEEIIRTAWTWHQKHPAGFEDGQAAKR
ncbi:MAG: UDP-glucose 4-epimerase GalE [Desulfovibrionaceae bacterium]|nr:UDP-glucose 4-epimerase GalE [Desulfovibrionaceae bacterium]